MFKGNTIRIRKLRRRLQQKLIFQEKLGTRKGKD
jgi:hypothetical protein